MSTPPSQGEGPTNEIDEPVVIEGLAPPNPDKVVTHLLPVFAPQEPSEASVEYKQHIECDAEFLLNNQDYSEMLADETQHLKEI